MNRTTGLACLVGVLVCVAQLELPGYQQAKAVAAAVQPKPLEPRKPLLPLRKSLSGATPDCGDQLCGCGCRSGFLCTCSLQSKEVEAGFHKGGPVSPDGTEVVVDLPEKLRKRNTGGMGPQGPGSGAGLCVFTSIMYSARWQNELRLWDFQKPMMSEPGGGYPGKVDAMINKYGSGTPYLQHTGGDEAFIEQSLATGRFPAITYAGHDRVYYNGPIAHMVNCAHLGKRWAAIMDNNYIETYLWMPRGEFLKRWRENGGGWVVTLLQPSASPIPHNLD